MDAEARTYQTIDDTLLYCYHVAGVVGVMMAMVMGVKDRAVLDRACDLGLAFQLTNIARDIVSDHEVDRVYLPEDWLASAGLNRANMADVTHRGQLSKVANRLLDTAEPYYRSAMLGLPHLPLRSAWAVAVALKVYRAIGLKVRERGAAAWDLRAGTRRRLTPPWQRGVNVMLMVVAEMEAGQQRSQPTPFIAARAMAINKRLCGRSMWQVRAEIK